MMVEDGQQTDLEQEAAIAAIGSRLQGLAVKCQSQKLELEKRWAEDLRQYNGEYDPQTKQQLANAQRSQAFVNLTRPKANISKGRLSEMVAPTDDMNWGLHATPIPENGMPPEQLAQQMALIEEAAKRMELTIHDQLSECDHNANVRDVVRNAVIYGTGIMKGVSVQAVTAQRWAKQQDMFGNVAHVMERITEYKPVTESVSPWDFYPDMSGGNKVDHISFAFQRHRYSKKQLRNLAQQGFDGKAIAAALAAGGGEETTSQTIQLRSETYAMVNREIYEVWEYHGTLTADEVSLLGCEVPQESPLAELYEMPVIAWVCNGQILKAAINPMDSGELPFSVFCWEDDDEGIFGFGVPYLLRHGQRVVNSSWRMVLDNAAMTVLPQTIIDDRALAPLDGNPNVTPGKTWKRMDRNTPIAESFVSIPIASNLTALGQIFNQAKALMDEEASIPLIAQGMNSGEVNNQTAEGMAMLMGAALTPLRDKVKSFDDNITKPIVRRFYDWNMQYNDDESIKGDFEIIANGSSALLEKERTASALMQSLQMAGANPILAQMTKFPELYRKFAKAIGLNPDDIIKTDDEIKAEQEQAAQQPAQQNPEMLKLQLEQQRLQLEAQMMQVEMQLKQQDMQVKQQVAASRAQADMARAQTAQLQAQGEVQERQIERETQMMKLAAGRDMTIAQVQTELQNAREQRAHDTDLFMAEAKIKLSQGSGL